MNREEYLKAERERMFAKVCPPEFSNPIKPELLHNHEAFNRVATWDGSFPGPCAFGATDSAKTRAAWAALRPLVVERSKSMMWFPVKKLVAEMARYEANAITEEFFKNCSYYDILFVDDADKFNNQFESEMSAIFSFYDYIYRNRRPCITTTNRSREGWSDVMGEAFTRRMFDDASFAVNFNKPISCQ